MRTIYRWVMRNGSPILCSLAIVLFLIAFGQAMLALKTSTAGIALSGQPLSEGISQFVLFLGGTLAAFQASVLPLIGALLLHRWDERAARER